MWTSCGGIGVSGKASLAAPDPSICCSLETSCKKFNDYFYQCMPDDYVPQKEAPPEYAATCTGTKVGSRHHPQPLCTGIMPWPQTLDCLELSQGHCPRGRHEVLVCLQCSFSTDGSLPLGVMYPQL